MIIAIDGPAGVGKSSVALAMAKQLNFQRMDSGAMYRAVAFWLNFMPEFLYPKTDHQWLEALKRMEYSQVGTSFFLNEADITKSIRHPKISGIASQIAVYPIVREVLVGWQREMGKEGNWVVEGRDMGTVVFPDAKLKIFLTASSEERAKRRYAELKEKGHKTTWETVMAEQEERDDRDKNRKVSPLKAADDAIEIDTTGLTLFEVIDKSLKLVKEESWQ